MPRHVCRQCVRASVGLSPCLRSALARVRVWPSPSLCVTPPHPRSCVSRPQVPAAVEHRFDFIDFKQRRKYASMVYYMDGVVAQITDALRAKKMWEHTLLLFTSDNGGPIYFPGSGSNHPLKGGKMADWEGGVRVNAFLAGGALPMAARGTKLGALVHIADWYATFAALAGVDGTTDPEAASAGLPPIDSVNMWPLLNSTVTSPGQQVPNDASAVSAAAPHVTSGRRETADACLASALCACGRTELHLSSQALLQCDGDGHLYKLVAGWQTGSGWVGPVYPNKTGHQPLPSFMKYPPIKLGTWAYDCGDPGCLYDVAADETEHNNIAPALPKMAKEMRARLDALNKGNYDPDRGQGDPAACRAAKDMYGGFYGPWVGVTEAHDTAIEDLKGGMHRMVTSPAPSAWRRA